MRERTRFTVFILTITSLFGVLGSCSPQPSRESNLILITVDTLRADRVGLYGYDRPTTPNIDRFFGSGLVYENANAASPCTIPSVEQILRGVVNVESRNLPRPVEGGSYLAERLQFRGYDTGAFVENDNLKAESHGSGYNTFWQLDVEEHDPVTSAGVLTSKALDWAERAEGPVHLWVHYYSPHRPFNPPVEWREFSLRPDDWKSLADPRVAKGETRKLLTEGIASVPSAPERVPQMNHLFDSNDWHIRGHVIEDTVEAYLRDSYDDEIRYVDHEIGRLLEGLERFGLLEDALIVFTSDHGEWLGERDVWHHCNSLHELELRVPLLAKFAGRDGPAGVIRQPVSTLDVMPTMLSHVGDELDIDIDGRALQAGGSGEIVGVWKDNFIFREGDWKLYLGDHKGLYNLASDPQERRNLYASHERVLRKLAPRALKLYAELSDMGAKTDTIEKELKALGYL